MSQAHNDKEKHLFCLSQSLGFTIDMPLIIVFSEFPPTSAPATVSLLPLLIIVIDSEIKLTNPQEKIFFFNPLLHLIKNNEFGNEQLICN